MWILISHCNVKKMQKCFSLAALILAFTLFVQILLPLMSLNSSYALSDPFSVSFLSLKHRFILCEIFLNCITILKVRELETDPLFNSGRGSALTEEGTVEMEASIMDGPKRRCGAVSGLTTVKNPISLARLVMDKSPHSYLAFSGAEKFAREQV